mgnify:CR=1 FL=1
MARLSNQPLRAGQRIAARIEYHGGHYHGWQAQPHLADRASAVRGDAVQHVDLIDSIVLPKYIQVLDRDRRDHALRAAPPPAMPGCGDAPSSSSTACAILGPLVADISEDACMLRAR